MSRILCLAVLCCVGIASTVCFNPAQAKPGRFERAAPPDPVISTEPPTEPRYDPATDLSGISGQTLIDTINQTNWGVAVPQTIWNFDLHRPLNNNSDIASGVSRGGLPFEIELSSIYIVGKQDIDGNNFGFWTGSISSGIGTGENFYCSGIYVERGNEATIIPLHAMVDQILAITTHSLLRKLRGFGPELPARCILDSTASFQNGQNQILIENCTLHQNEAAIISQTTCFVVGLGTCWWTAGVGCAAGLICMTVNTVNFAFFRQRTATAAAAALACLCFESNWRTLNPGLPLPSASCGTFACPPVLPIPGLK